jgi:hypothetical protein
MTSPRHRGRGAKIRAALPKVALDLFIVFAGVYTAFGLENYRNSREQNHRREAVCRALDRELGQMAETQGPAFQREMTRELAEWDGSISRGERPLPPAFKLAGAERPPTGVWDAAVASNSLELIQPELFFELARFYNRAKSAGDLYQRYATGAQADVWPRLAEGQNAFWDSNGRLRPEIIADVQRLRDFKDRQADLGKEARQLRSELRNSCGS